MKRTTVKKDAQEMVIKSFTDSINFSIEFYKDEQKQYKATDNEYMVEHCREMIKAYATLKFMIEHFKF